MWIYIVIAVIVVIGILRKSQSDRAIKAAVLVSLVIIGVGLVLTGGKADKYNSSDSIYLVSGESIQSIHNNLTTQDSIELRTELEEIGKYIEAIFKQSEKAKKQHDQFANLFANMNTSAHKYYEATKEAKQAMYKSGEKISSIRIPEKMPYNGLRDTLNMALSNISTYFYTMKDAYDIIMNIMDNGEEKGNFAKADRFIEQKNLAKEAYSEGLLYFISVEHAMGIKQVKKKK